MKISVIRNRTNEGGFEVRNTAIVDKRCFHCAFVTRTNGRLLTRAPEDCLGKRYQVTTPIGKISKKFGRYDLFTASLLVTRGRFLYDVAVKRLQWITV